jgi:hypothetical protein
MANYGEIKISKKEKNRKVVSFPEGKNRKVVSFPEGHHVGMHWARTQTSIICFLEGKLGDNNARRLLEQPVGLQ